MGAGFGFVVGLGQSFYRIADLLRTREKISSSHVLADLDSRSISAVHVAVSSSKAYSRCCSISPLKLCCSVAPEDQSKRAHSPAGSTLFGCCWSSDSLMGTEDSTDFAIMGRRCSDRSIADDSSAFSDCNSDRSGEFSTHSAQNRLLLVACSSDNSDDQIRQLVLDLESCSIEEQKQAAMEIRLLAKNKQENRLKFAKSGAIKPLINLIASTDPQLQENGVTAILNLSLCDENKELITSSGAIKPLVRTLSSGSQMAKENAACALLRLSQIEENKILIARSGAIPPLVNLLENGGFRGKKDASTALYSLCSVKENKIKAVEAGIMKPLIELMADFGSNMVDKSAFVLSLLVSVPEGRAAMVEEGGIPVLVEIIEVGTQRQKEISVAILLQICEESATYRNMVAREGAIPPLVALSQSGTNRAKQKAEKLTQLLRQPRSLSVAATTSVLSV